MADAPAASVRPAPSYTDAQFEGLQVDLQKAEKNIHDLRAALAEAARQRDAASEESRGYAAQVDVLASALKEAVAEVDGPKGMRARLSEATAVIPGLEARAKDADALRAELSSAKAECAALRETRSRLTAQLDVLATEKAGDADRRAAAAAAECTQLAAELASAREAAAAAERRTEGLASAAGQLAAAQEQAAAAREEVELLRRDLERARAEAGRKDQAGAEMQKTIREKEAEIQALRAALLKAQQDAGVAPVAAITAGVAGARLGGGGSQALTAGGVGQQQGAGGPPGDSWVAKQWEWQKQRMQQLR